MYDLEVFQVGKTWKYEVTLGVVVVAVGFRASEGLAREAGHEDLKLCRSFRVGSYNS